MRNKYKSLINILFLLITAGLLIWHMIEGKDVSNFLIIVFAFVFRGWMWELQYLKKIERLEFESNDPMC